MSIRLLPTRLAPISLVFENNSAMRRFWLILCLICAVHWVQGEDNKLPSYISVCYRDNPRVADCLKNEIKRLLPILKTGSKEFNLQSLDPMVIPGVSFKYKNKLLGGNVFIPKTTVYGLTNAKVLRVRPKVNDPKRLVIEFDVNFDKVRVQGSYNLTGNVDKIPISMDGNLDLEFGDISMTFKLVANVKEVDGVDYLFLESVKTKYTGDTPKTLKILNDNLVNSKPALNRLVTSIVKVSWKILKNPIVASMQSEYDKHYLHIFLEFFKKFPYDVIFPKNMPKKGE